MEGEARVSRSFKLGLMSNTADASILMLQTGGFQSQVNVQPAPGVEGDFCSNNPRHVVNAGPGGLVAGPAGATVGRFCWATGPVDGDGFPTQVSSSFSGDSILTAGGTVPYGVNAALPLGLLRRDQQALITQFLADSTMTMSPGFPVTLFNAGDFWVKNRGAGAAQPGMKAYANFADGGITFAASGSPTSAATVTGNIAPALATITATISGNILSVSALASGTLTPGMSLSGSGSGQSVSAGSVITSQLTGSTGGVGTYSLNIPEQVISTAITMNGSVGLLTIANFVSGGPITAGMLLTGTGGGGVAAGTYVAGPGLVANTWYVNPSQTVTQNPSIAAQGNIETKWFAVSYGLAGELVKMSSTTFG